MATPRQRSETEIKLEKVKAEIQRLKRVERRYKTLLITLTMDANSQHLDNALIELAERHSKINGYDYHKNSIKKDQYNG